MSTVPRLDAAAPHPAELRPSVDLHPCVDLHPSLWRAHQLGRPAQATVPTGFAALDAQLPGGGWPQGQLTELLLPHPGVGEMRLLAPALARLAAAGEGIMLFDPPARLCAAALAQLGVDAQQLLVVHGREGARGAAVRHLLASADLLWALEQALKSGHVGAVLAWLPSRLRADALRRLQLAAQAHPGPVLLLRDIEERLKPSPAPLRLALHSAGGDALWLRVLKRRGPALAQPLHLALPPVLAAALRTRPATQAGAAALPPQAADLRPDLLSDLSPGRPSDLPLDPPPRSAAAQPAVVASQSVA